MAQVLVPIAVTADDQNMERVDGASYPPASTITRTTSDTLVYSSKVFTNPGYYVRNGLLRFDTGSALPDDAIVTGATLRMFVDNALTQDSRSFTIGWYVWDGTSNSDYTETAETDAFAGIAMGSVNIGFDNDFVLLNPRAHVSVTGYTHLRTHCSGSTAPTGVNIVHGASIDDPTNPEPRLVVDYVTGGYSRLAPDAILAQTNLTGAVSAIQDDPDSETGVWLTAP